MLIGIVILNWNKDDYTKRCLESIDSLRFDDIRLNTYLIDNNSEQFNEMFMTQALPGVNIIRLDDNVGYTGGNNVGIDAAMKDQCEFVFIANNDTIFTESLIPELLKTIEQDESIASVSPKVLFYKEQNKIQFGGGKLNLYFGKYEHLGYGSIDDGSFDTEKEIDFFTGCGVLLKSSVIRELGKFEDSFFAYCEDIELSVRIRRAGYKLYYNGNAAIYHDESPSLGGYLNPLAFYLSKRNSVYLINMHGTVGQRFCYLIYSYTFFLLAVAGYAFLKERFDLLKMYVRALKDSLKGVKGKPDFF